MRAVITDFSQLISRTREVAEKSHVPRAALIGADDAKHLRAVKKTFEEGILEPVLIGPEAAINKCAEEAEIDISDFQIIHVDSRNDMVEPAIKLMREKEIDYAIAGIISTEMLLSQFLNKETGFKAGHNLISHVAAFEHDSYPRLLLMTDSAVVVAPDLNVKLRLIQNAVTVANRLGVAMPKVAILAAVEVIYPNMPVTIEGAVISKMVDKGQIKNCLVDGPLSMDVATVPEAARQKGAASPVAGNADILIAPNIETGSGIYKAMSLFTPAKTAGVIVGGTIPVALSSRCDNSDNIVNSLALAGMLALPE